MHTFELLTAAALVNLDLIAVLRPHGPGTLVQFKLRESFAKTEHVLRVDAHVNLKILALKDESLPESIDHSFACACVREREREWLLNELEITLIQSLLWLRA